MIKAHTSKSLKEACAKSSPLFDYWNSNQSDKDEESRLQKSLRSSPAAVLFLEEPYKWEILFQSIIREIYKGDKDAIKGLKLLIKMVQIEEQEMIFGKLKIVIVWK